MKTINKLDIRNMIRAVLLESLDTGLVVEGSRSNLEITVLSREFVNRIKSFLQRRPGNPDLEVNIAITPENSTIFKRLPNLVLIHFRIDTGMWAPYSMEAYHDEENKEIFIGISLSRQFRMKTMNFLVGDIKNALAHEIQHSFQEEDYEDPSFKVNKDTDNEYNVYATLRDVKNYHSDHVELEAYIKGLHRTAKFYKKPLVIVIDDHLKTMYDHHSQDPEFTGSKSDLRRYFFVELKQQLISYARKMAPMAIFSGPAQQSDRKSRYVK